MSGEHVTESKSAKWQYRVVLVFGLLNLLGLLVTAIFPFHVDGRLYSWPEAAGQMSLQALVAAALVYASQQRLLGSEIGEKAYPAALVAYLLWACMMLRWASL